MKQTLYIFRHGKAVADGKEYGDTILTATLLPEAIPPLERMSEFLKTVTESKNFCSQVIRCQQTAEIVTKITGKIFITDPRLNEYYLEDFSDLTKRVALFLQEISGLEEENILICTHGAVIAALKHLITEKTFEEKDQFDFPRPGELLIIKDNAIAKMSFL